MPNSNTVLQCTLGDTYLKREALKSGQTYSFTWISPFTNRTILCKPQMFFTDLISWRETLEARIDTGSVFLGDSGSIPIKFWPCGLHFLSGPLAYLEQLPPGKIWHILHLNTRCLLTIIPRILPVALLCQDRNQLSLKALDSATFPLASFRDGHKFLLSYYFIASSFF